MRERERGKEGVGMETRERGLEKWYVRPVWTLFALVVLRSRE